MNRIWRSTSAAALLCSSALRAQTPPPAAAPAAPPAPATVAPAGAPGPAPPPAPLDQGPDTLPSLDAPATVVVVHPKPGNVAVVGNATPREPLPVRAERRLALMGELGWNTLSGFGPTLTFHAHPHLSFDLGAGLSPEGWKLGLRSRYNFLSSEVTPFVGVGLIGASGIDSPSQDLSSDGDNSELNIKVRPCGFLQTVVGVDWTSSGGFTLVGALGYAWLLGGDNVEVVTGVPSEEDERVFDAVFRSAIVISLGIGYSFR
jgi:hypothetical protein